MKNIFQLLLVLIAFQSCDIVVDLDIEEHTPVLVLNSILNPDSVLTVHISHSLGAFECGQIRPLDDVIVRLYENETYIADAITFYSPNSSDNYIFQNVYPQEGFTYKIVAEHKDYARVHSICTLPNRVFVSIVKVDTTIRYQDEFYTDYKVDVSYQFDDASNEQNHYLLELFSVEDNYTYPTSFYSNEAIFGSS